MSGEVYTDPLYHAAAEMQIPNISGTSTVTASDAAGLIPKATDASKFELFARCKLLAMKAQILTAGNVSSSHLLLMNGTTQLGDIAIGTNTALTDVDGTMTAAACADIAANTELQVDVTGTQTVNAGVCIVGPLNLRLTYQRLFA